jgi:hypothetical protein
MSLYRRGRCDAVAQRKVRIVRIGLYFLQLAVYFLLNLLANMEHGNKSGEAIANVGQSSVAQHGRNFRIPIPRPGQRAP